MSWVAIFDRPRIIAARRYDFLLRVLSELLIPGPCPSRRHNSSRSPVLTLRRPYFIVVLSELLLIKVFIVYDKRRLSLGVLTLVELLFGWPWDWLPCYRALLCVHLFEARSQMLAVPRILILWIHLDHRLKLQSSFIAKARMFIIFTSSLDLPYKLYLRRGLIQPVSKVSLPRLEMLNLLELPHELFTWFIHDVAFRNPTAIYWIEKILLTRAWHQSPNFEWDPLEISKAAVNDPIFVRRQFAITWSLTFTQVLFTIKRKD